MRERERERELERVGACVRALSAAMARSLRANLHAAVRDEGWMEKKQFSVGFQFPS